MLHELNEARLAIYRPTVHLNLALVPLVLLLVDVVWLLLLAFVTWRKYRRLYLAAIEWSCDRFPRDGEDCDLLAALWKFDGDRKKPCPGCDGECGELCAPTTAAVQIAALQAQKLRFRFHKKPGPQFGRRLSDSLDCMVQEVQKFERENGLS